MSISRSYRLMFCVRAHGAYSEEVPMVHKIVDDRCCDSFAVTDP